MRLYGSKTNYEKLLKLAIEFEEQVFRVDRVF